MYDFIIAFFGGGMIGLAAILLMATHGKVMGVSGIVSRLLPPTDSDWSWRATFIAGVLTAPLLFPVIAGQEIEIIVTGNLLILIISGLLVGLGTVTGNGCTSGHGVCGLPRLSIRSIIATVTFMVVGIITVFVKNHLMGE